MEEISITEVRKKLADCISQVEKGKRFIVTQHGQPVAILAPVDEYWLRIFMDRDDIELAQEAMADETNLSLEEVREALALDKAS